MTTDLPRLISHLDAANVAVTAGDDGSAHAAIDIVRAALAAALAASEGTPILPAAISDGDVLFIGGDRFVYRAGAWIKREEELVMDEGPAGLGVERTYPGYRRVVKPDGSWFYASEGTPAPVSPEPLDRTTIETSDDEDRCHCGFWNGMTHPMPCPTCGTKACRCWCHERRSFIETDRTPVPDSDPGFYSPKAGNYGQSAAPTPATLSLDMERLARAIHSTYKPLHAWEACDHEPVYGEGRTECQYDAQAILAEYARLTAAASSEEGTE